MNKLFSLLMAGYSIPSSFSWYAKKVSTVIPTTKTTAIVNLIMRGVPDNRRVLFASAICNMVLSTQYGTEISKLDSNNTYVPVVRDPDAAHSAPEHCINDLIQPIHFYKDLLLYLQDDIVEMLDSDSWFDLIGAACLQILRETT